MRPDGSGIAATLREEQNIPRGRRTWPDKVLDAILWRHALPFEAFVRPAGSQALILLCSAAGPLDDSPLDHSAFAQSEGQGQFRLGEITGAGLHDAGLNQGARIDANQ